MIRLLLMKLASFTIPGLLVLTGAVAEPPFDEIGELQPVVFTGDRVGDLQGTPIDEIWNGPLQEEHRRIYAQEFSAEKDELICTRCSQAEYGNLERSPVKGVPVIGAQELARHALKGTLSSV